VRASPPPFIATYGRFQGNILESTPGGSSMALMELAPGGWSRMATPQGRPTPRGGRPWVVPPPNRLWLAG
jgi:hypothetical protein